MRLTLVLHVCVLSGLAVGCAGSANRRDSADSRSGPALRDGVIEPSYVTAGQVASVNRTAKFVVVTYPFGSLPPEGRRLNVYRHGIKVGELKVSGPRQETSTIADILSGQIEVGDETRDD